MGRLRPATLYELPLLAPRPTIPPYNQDEDVSDDHEPGPEGVEPAVPDRCLQQRQQQRARNGYGITYLERGCHFGRDEGREASERAVCGNGGGRAAHIGIDYVRKGARVDRSMEARVSE